MAVEKTEIKVSDIKLRKLRLQLKTKEGRRRFTKKILAPLIRARVSLDGSPLMLPAIKATTMKFLADLEKKLKDLEKKEDG